MRLSGRGRRRRFGLGVGREDQAADAMLRRSLGERPQEREAAPLVVHAVGASRERHAPPFDAAALPHREAQQLQAGQRPFAHR